MPEPVIRALGQVDPVEILGFLTGAACVWLLVRQNIWTWPVGIANNLFFIVLFFHSRLYGDMALQFVFIGISVYGWWHWVHGGTGESGLRISRTGAVLAAALLAATAAGTAAIDWFLRAFTPSTTPFLDALTTALSLTAIFMQSRKLLENWLVWILADLFYLGLYTYKGLYFTTVLYGIFLGMCVAGWWAWRRAYAAGAAAAGRLEAAA
jgi:nicotinamide mononucleotide transporter